MKKTLILSILSLSILFAVPTKEAIDTIVEEIKPPRTGLSHQTISVIKNPFVLTKKTTDKTGKVTQISSKIRRYSTHSSSRVTHFRLYATLNKSAKINYKWIPLNGKISGYTLKSVTKEFVTLQKGNAKPVTVYLNSKNKKIKLMTK